MVKTMKCEKCKREMKQFHQRWIGKKAIPAEGWICCMCEVVIYEI